MAGSFENEFKAFIQSQQSSNYSKSDYSPNSDDESCEEDLLECDESEPYLKIRRRDYTGKKIETNGISQESQQPIPKLKLVVDPNYVATENLSPFSLKRYIKSPNSHFLKLDSCSDADQTKNNFIHPSPKQVYDERHYVIKTKFRSNYEISEKNKRELFPGKLACKSVIKKEKSNGRPKCSYQAQIVLKKYGICFASKRKRNKKGTEKVSNSNSLSKDLNFNQILQKQTDHDNVNKAECGSHYFCSQGEGLSRNSPEAAKSVISSPANVSIGESCLTDVSVSPMYDPPMSVTASLGNHEGENAEMQDFVVDEDHFQREEKKIGHEKSSMLDIINSGMKYNCGKMVPGTEYLKDENIKKCRRFTIGAESEANFTDIVSHHLSSHYVDSSTRNETDTKSSKQKRNCSDIPSNHHPDFLYNVSDDNGGDDDDYSYERKKCPRSRRHTFTSCFCCLKKSSKYVRKSLIKCNISDFKYLSAEQQKFVHFSVQMSNIQTKLHLLFCSVFPKLVPILNSISPESHQFRQIIDAILHSLQTSEDEELQNDTVKVVSMFEELHLKHSTQVVPIFEANVQLCQNPEYCINVFRDKVVSLLQLLLPSLIISLDNFISNTKELDKFLDKVISSNKCEMSKK